MVHGVICRMWDFSLHHNSHQCRPIFGSSLPYALSISCDEISNSLLDSDNLVIDITSFGNLLFKSFCLFLPRSSRRGHFFLLISILAFIGIYRIVKLQKLQISTLHVQQAVQASTTENWYKNVPD